MTISNPIQILNFIPDSFIDDYFFFGFFAGIIGYLYYLFTNRHDPKNHLNFIAGFYGMILSGALGGMLAIVFDRSYEVSILVGLLNQLIYMALLRSIKSNQFWKVIREVMIKYITMGKGL